MTGSVRSCVGVNRLMIWTVFLCVLLAQMSFRQAPHEPAPDFKVKAIFLFNFVQFVEWPEGTFEAADSPIVIGILGDDPFGAYLDETVKGELVRGHAMEIRRYRAADEAVKCHVLYVNQSRAEKIEQVLTSIKGRHILTVGETTAFTKNGGMIRFFSDNNKVRIRINLEETKEENLTISSRLLKLAEIVSSSSP